MDILKLVFLLLAATTSQVTSKAVNITMRWTLPQQGFQHFLRYFEHPATWDDAKTICDTFDAQLLIADTGEKRDTIKTYLRELNVINNVWCGLERSSAAAPFVWTGGGQSEVRDDVGDIVWQEPPPLQPERLCVHMNPQQDYRWQATVCDQEINPFVCQLPVPDWADGCLSTSLPSVTTTYLPGPDGPGLIQLVSDCGLAGTKTLACKGPQNQEELNKRLACEGESEAWTWTPASVTATRNWGSSGTRHKRDSTSTAIYTEIPASQEDSTTTSNKLITETTHEEIITEPKPFIIIKEVEDAVESPINQYVTEQEKLGEESKVSTLDTSQAKSTTPKTELPTQLIGIMSQPRPPTMQQPQLPVPIETFVDSANDNRGPMAKDKNLSRKPHEQMVELTPDHPPIQPVAQVLVNTPLPSLPPLHERGGNMPHPPLMQRHSKQNVVPSTSTTNTPMIVGEDIFATQESNDITDLDFSSIRSTNKEAVGEVSTPLPEEEKINAKYFKETSTTTANALLSESTKNPEEIEGKVTDLVVNNTPVITSSVKVDVTPSEEIFSPTFTEDIITNVEVNKTQDTDTEEDKEIKTTAVQISTENPLLKGKTQGVSDLLHPSEVNEYDEIAVEELRTSPTVIPVLEGKTDNQEGEDSTEKVTYFPEHSSEEALVIKPPVPKRNGRGRGLYHQGGPLSFYPYFLSKVLG